MPNPQQNTWPTLLALRWKTLKSWIADFDQLNVNKMDLEERIALVVHNSDEVVTQEELRSVLETTSRPRAYWGFECSGQ
jgi:hypothetical protein